MYKNMCTEVSFFCKSVVHVINRFVQYFTCLNTKKLFWLNLNYVCMNISVHSISGVSIVYVSFVSYFTYSYHEHAVFIF